MSLFSDLVKVDAINPQTYKAELPDEWCIGSVPHGGAVTSVLLAVAQKHFYTTLASQNQPHCIIIHVDFVQRTSAGLALVKVTNIKLGRQTSTVQLTLTQDGRDEVIAMLTHANITAETGVSFPTAWSLDPKPPPTNLKKLAESGTDGVWKPWKLAMTKFRKAATKVDIYLPGGGRVERGVIDQWIKFKSGERFTNLSLGYLCDMFPQLIETYTNDDEAMENSGTSKKTITAHWYPTLALNLDIKRALPEEGVEWIFARIQSKAILNGRMDLEIIMFNEAMELIAISHHVAMIVSTARNLAKRGEGKKQLEDGSKL
ncbi:thioesterase-like superfamily-domain-containing protein [Xylariales sp. PMI_506]|nr:thioesterase-like superfamily-domain-containing protein [Xylariales sp. PMI_506]